MPSRSVTPLPSRSSYPRATSIAQMQSAGRDVESIRRDGLISQALNGKLNCTGEVTLAVSPATSTTYTDPLITADSVVLIVPKTATAAAAVLGVYVVPTFGSATINHTASALTDRTYRVAILG